MAAHLGVDTNFGLTTPDGGYVQEASREESIEVATIRDEAGVTVVAVPKPLVTRSVSIRGRGDAELSAVTSGAFTAGALKIVSARQSETNDDFPEFEITATAYEDID